jgi:hypothetical protein
MNSETYVTFNATFRYNFPGLRTRDCCPEEVVNMASDVTLVDVIFSNLTIYLKHDIHLLTTDDILKNHF